MLRKGAETVVKQCLNIQEGETVLLVNDGNDQDLIDALKEVIEEEASLEFMEYEQPETSGTEPPEEVAERMKKVDVFLAPTVKSISHTQAREDAVAAGTRGATMPGITKEIWKSSLQADYNRVKEITQKAYEHLEDGQRITIETPSGTDLSFRVRMDSFFQDTGIMHNPGDFGNLPAGEIHGGVVEANGTLVIDHFPHAPAGTEVEIRDSKVVSIHGESELAEKLSIDCVKNIAEFGFGTNPEATLIGKTLQDEKVLGTVHVAFGDNSHYFPGDHERFTQCDIHWDTVCEKPTVRFGDKLMIENGEPVFLD